MRQFVGKKQAQIDACGKSQPTFDAAAVATLGKLMLPKSDGPKVMKARFS